MMKQDFKNVAYMSVFVLIVGAGYKPAGNHRAG